MAKVFRVARNLDSGSTLPYQIPTPDHAGDLVLKAPDVWPRTAKPRRRVDVPVPRAALAYADEDLEEVE